MTTLREAAQQALEALKCLVETHEMGNTIRADIMDAEEAITALKAALEQPEQPEQEPFGYIWPTGRHPEFRYTQQMRDGVAGMPLYTHPPRREWRSLSEEEIIKLVRGVLEKPINYCEPAAWQLAGGITRAVEAALRSKNYE